MTVTNVYPSRVSSCNTPSIARSSSLPNDFQLKEGHEFHSQSPFGPSPCKVVEIAAPYRLSFAWDTDGWVVTFILKDLGDKTEFTLIHSGWKHPDTVISRANKKSSRVELYMGILEDDFDQTIRLMQEYVNDEDLLKLSTLSREMTDFERTLAVLRLKNRLDLLKKSSKFIDNAMAFIPSMNRMVTSNDNAIAGFDPSLFRALAQPTNRFESPFLLWNGQVFISIPYSDTIYSRQPLFLIAVKISRHEISSTLNQFTNSGGEAILASNRFRWAVSGKADPVIGHEVLVYGQKHSDGGRTDIVTVEDKQFMVAMKTSRRLDMTLLMFVPTEIVDTPLQSYRNWLVTLSIISIFIVLAFAYGIYRIIHQPLKWLVRSFRKIEQGNFDISVRYSVTYTASSMPWFGN